MNSLDRILLNMVNPPCEEIYCVSWILNVENSNKKWVGNEGKNMVGMSTTIEVNIINFQPC